MLKRRKCRNNLVKALVKDRGSAATAVVVMGSRQFIPDSSSSNSNSSSSISSWCVSYAEAAAAAAAAAVVMLTDPYSTLTVFVARIK